MIGDRDDTGGESLAFDDYSRINAVQAIVERIMTQHWDMGACGCWVCAEGRDAGCRPRDRYLNHKGDPRPHVGVDTPQYTYQLVLRPARRAIP